MREFHYSREEIPEPFRSWRDADPQVAMNQFRSIAFLYEAIRGDLQQHPEWTTTQYHYVSEDDNGKQLPEVFKGVDRTFVFGLWLTRRNLTKALSAAAGAESVENILSEIEGRYRARESHVRIPVRVV